MKTYPSHKVEENEKKQVPHDEKSIDVSEMDLARKQKGKTEREGNEHRSGQIWIHDHVIIGLSHFKNKFQFILDHFGI
jgi:hypothetical protein